MTKWVYSFSAERAEGRGEMKNLLGGKGANLHEMAHLGLPVPPGFTITTELCTYFYANGKTYPPDLAGAGRRRGRGGRKTDRPRLWRRLQSPPAVGPVGRARIDAGHDGHRPQSRPQRHFGRHARQDLGRRALRLRQLSPLHPDVFERRARRRQPQFRGHPRAIQGRQGLLARHRPQGRRLAHGHRRIQGQGPGGDWQALPAGAEGPALGRDRGRLLVLDERARDHVSPAQQHPGRLGHGRQRAGDGVRQHGRVVGDRGRLHPQPVDRRERALRRVPGQRPGRGRRRRHPHAAEHHRSRAQGRRLRQALARVAHARGVPSVRRDDEAAGEALQRHAGHGVHGRARQALDAADPQRQAHRARSAQGRRRDGQ